MKVISGSVKLLAGVADHQHGVGVGQQPSVAERWGWP